MKKIFSFVLGMLAMTSIQAANTEVARLTLTGQGGTESSYVTLRVNPDVNETSAYFGATDEVGQVNIYAIEGTSKYSAYTANQIVNLPIEIITNRRAATMQHYTISFKVPTKTDGLKLKDLVTGDEVDIVANGSYEFYVNSTLHPDYVAETNYVVKDRFVINYVAYTAEVTTNEYGWASFSYDQDLVPVNATAQTLYKGAINGEFLDLDEVDYVPNGQGVLVNGDANTTYYFAAGSGSDDFTGNALKATATYNTSMQNVYVLKGNAFLEYVGTNALAANKAYIQLPSAGPNNAPKRITMRFNGTTAVDNVEAESVKAEKFVENGQVYIRRGNEVYNLQGQIIK